MNFREQYEQLAKNAEILYNLEFVDFDFQDHSQGYKYIYKNIDTGITATLQRSGLVYLTYKSRPGRPYWVFETQVYMRDFENSLKVLIENLKLLKLHL